MVYPLSATKLQHYQRCPQAYAFQYEYGLKQSAVFGAAALGQALHQALAMIYQDWHYQEPKPGWEWFEGVWRLCCTRLTDRQVAEGWQILQGYYQAFVQPEKCRPGGTGTFTGGAEASSSASVDVSFRVVC
jgi:putative RecB family exonuclease